jgi:hypothetical protein
MLRRVVWQKLVDVSEMLAAFMVRVMTLLIVLMMEATSTSETLEMIYETTRSIIPQDSHLHTGMKVGVSYKARYFFITGDDDGLLRTAVFHWVSYSGWLKPVVKLEVDTCCKRERRTEHWRTALCYRSVYCN